MLGGVTATDALLVGVEYLGPFAAFLVAVRIILGFQKAVVSGSLDHTRQLEARLVTVEQRADRLDAEVIHCDRRASILVRALIEAGVEVPPDALAPFVYPEEEAP